MTFAGKWKELDRNKMDRNHYVKCNMLEIQIVLAFSHVESRFKIIYMSVYGNVCIYKI